MKKEYFVTDRQTEIVTSWAPVGAAKKKPGAISIFVAICFSIAQSRAEWRPMS